MRRTVASDGETRSSGAPSSASGQARQAENGRGSPVAWVLLTLASLAVIAPLVYLLVRAAQGDDIADLVKLSRGIELVHARHDLLAPVVVSLVGGIVLAGLAIRALRRDRAVAPDEQLRAELSRERGQRARVERAREVEREWSRELREQIRHLHDSTGPLGDWNDLRAVVLRMAITLVGADKGMLLERGEDGDGLSFACAQGFEHDASQSAVAGRFAREVIERDRTVREDSTQELRVHGSCPADEEIDNLVAIPIYIQDQFSGAVICVNKEGGFAEHDEDVLLSIGDQAGAALENSRLHGEARGTYLSVIRMLADAVEVKDPSVSGHGEEVSELVAPLARRLDLPPDRREALVFGSLLQDIGKLGISERILLKPGALSPEERSVIQLHPRIGYRLVQHVPALNDIAPAILYHHERYDGEGYPAGLRGEQIPIEARVIAVIDAYTAMIGQRPYNEPLSPEDAMAELERCAGSQFDPQVVGMFCEEVRARILREQDAPAEVPRASDPELDARRDGVGSLLGASAFELTDNLTLLHSHRHLHEMADAEAHRAAVQGHPFSIVMVELLDLGEVNRRDGYAAGDGALKQVASVMRHTAVRTGATACRASGRRLALALPVDEDEAHGLIETLRSDLHDGPRVAIASATWRPEERGDEVIARAGLAASADAIGSAAPRQV